MLPPYSRLCSSNGVDSDIWLIKLSTHNLEKGNFCCRMLFLFLTQGKCSNALAELRHGSCPGKGLLNVQLVFNNFAIKGHMCVSVDGS
ncbi:hypothetical protein E2320_018276, partial [Naja naja]